MKTIYNKETGEITGWYHSSRGDQNINVGTDFGEIEGKFDEKKYFIKDGKPVKKEKLRSASVRKVGNEVVISGLPKDSYVITGVKRHARAQAPDRNRVVMEGRKDRRDDNGEVRFTIPAHMRNQKLSFTIDGVDIEVSELEFDTTD